jgi:hypothetical protein
MRAKFSGLDSPTEAITDLYDEKRRTFLVQYPVWVVVALGLTGVLAFMLTGFLGFHDKSATTAGSPYSEPGFIHTLFLQPWPLYLWFCALIYVLQISILRNPKLRRQLVETLLVTTFCVIIVGISYYYNKEIQQFLQNLLTQIFNIRIPQIGNNPLTYTILNFLVIAIFWMDTIRRWIRRARGLPPASHVAIDLSANPSQSTIRRLVPPEEMPSMQELVSGDLIAAAVLTLVLSLLFRDSVISGLSHLLNVNVPVDNCVVAWPIGHCVAPGGTITDPPTLTFIDLIQALIYLPLGLIILALSATLSGLGAVGGVNEQQLNPVPAGSQDETSTESVSEQVSLTVLNTLRSALNRRLRVASDNLALSLRNAVWPLLILLGVIAVAAASRDIQTYLHLLSDQRTCTTAACPDFANVQNLLDSQQQYVNIGLAVVWGVVAVVSIVIAVTLLIFNLRVAENSFRFLGLIGFIVLLTFWIFSLALSGFNGLFSLTGLSHRVPFPQPGVATIISLAALLIFGVLLLFRRVRGPRAPVSEPAAVGARQSS